MAKDEIDDLIAAIETVEFLQDALKKQETLITGIFHEIHQLGERVTRIEKRRQRPKS